jgi:multidrug efflux pump subunit AcrA (membrane-fusion protein)
MSVSAAIITDTKQNILIVPQSAVKSLGEANYIETLDAFKNTTNDGDFSNKGVVSAIPPVRETVTIGASNDIATEVAGGLKEGDVIIIRTITAAAAPTQQSSGGLRIPGIGGGSGGGALRGAAGGR